MQNWLRKVWDKWLHVMAIVSVSCNVKNVVGFCNDTNDFFSLQCLINFTFLYMFMYHQFFIVNEGAVVLLSRWRCTSKFYNPYGLVKPLVQIKLELGKDSLTPSLGTILKQLLGDARIPTLGKIPVPNKNTKEIATNLQKLIRRVHDFPSSPRKKNIKGMFCEQVKHYTDCFQFGHTTNRCVHNAILFLYILYLSTRTNILLSYFSEFLSAFTTIQQHIMMQELNNMDVNTNQIDCGSMIFLHVGYSFLL